MSVIFLTLVANLCNISSAENVNTKWSSPVQAEIYKLQCITWYIECEKERGLGDVTEVCIEKRLKLLQEKK